MSTMDSEISEPTKMLLKREGTGIRAGGKLGGMKGRFRELYTAILKEVIFALECIYRLRSPPPIPNLVLPAPRDGVSIAHHFAAYLALSQVRAMVWKIPNEETEILLPSPARGGTDIKSFKGVALAPWMKEIPALIDQYAAALRRKDTWCGVNKIKPISWIVQVAAPNAADEYFKAIALAADVAYYQTIQLQPRQEPPTAEELQKYKILEYYARLHAEEEAKKANASASPDGN